MSEQTATRDQQATTTQDAALKAFTDGLAEAIVSRGGATSDVIAVFTLAQTWAKTLAADVLDEFAVTEGMVDPDELWDRAQGLRAEVA